MNEAPHQQRRERTMSQSHCLVVMYHYVHDTTPITAREDTALRSGELKAQLDSLCRELEPIDWPTFFAWTQNRAGIPDRSFLLTFDDGLADHAENVFPILKDRGLHGVFFVPALMLTTQRMLPAHTIHLLMSMMGEGMFRRALFEYLNANATMNEHDLTIDTVDAEMMYHYETPERAHLKYLLTMKLPCDVRNQAVDALFEQHIGSSARWSRRWYLKWDDLIQMQADGHTVGGHGFHHEPYSRLTHTEQRSDLRRTASILREGLGPDLRPFSYPYGSCTDDTAAACREAGFVQGFTTKRDWVTLGSDVMQLPRVDTIDVNAALRELIPCPPN